VLVGGEKSVKGVVSRDDETSNVGQELTAKVENDKEEVEGNEANDGVGLGDGCALFEVDESRVLGQLRRKIGVSCCVV